MLSHTVPKKLLEHFAYDDRVTRSKRLWRYEKERSPYGMAAPKSATRWPGHFADPSNSTKELEIERRLKQEFEDPVNAFIDLFRYETFAFTSTHIRLLTGYITMLFHRSRARREASPGQHERLIGSLQSLRGDDERLSRLIAKQTLDLIPQGLRRLVTKEEIIAGIDSTIREHSSPDAPQRRYLETMEHMMGFVDEHMLRGEWRMLRSAPDHPFVIGDAPVVTWERTPEGLMFGMGFARSDVEVFFPVFPTVCLHILPTVSRTRAVHVPSTDDVNRAEAAFATQYCFTNIGSMTLDAVLQPYFGTFRLGREGFNLDHLDHAGKLFELLMQQRPPQGTIVE